MLRKQIFINNFKKYKSSGPIPVSVGAGGPDPATRSPDIRLYGSGYEAAHLDQLQELGEILANNSPGSISMFLWIGALLVLNHKQTLIDIYSCIFMNLQSIFYNIFCTTLYFYFLQRKVTTTFLSFLAYLEGFLIWVFKQDTTSLKSGFDSILIY